MSITNSSTTFFVGFIICSIIILILCFKKLPITFISVIIFLNIIIILINIFDQTCSHRYYQLTETNNSMIKLINQENKIFMGERIDNKGAWQMPQGGVDKNEDFLTAAFRELDEETSIKSVELIKELDGFITYNLPDHLLGIIWKGKYKGQTQKWFVMRFIGEDSEININTKHPEFLEWKWVELSEITKLVVNFKLDLYQEVQRKVEKIIN